MTLALTPKTRTIQNGTDNDGSVVDIQFTELYNNDAAIATYINNNGRLPTGYRGSGPPVYASGTTFTLTNLRERSIDDKVDIINNSIITVNIANVGVVNGLDQGSIAANTIYYLYAISYTDGSNAGLLLSTVNEAVTGSIALPTNYTKKRQMPFWILTNSVPQFLSWQVGAGWPNQPYVFYNAQQETAYNGSSIVTGTSQLLFLNGAGPNSFTQYNVTALPPICGRGVFHFVVDTVGTFTNFDFNTTGSAGPASYVQGTYVTDQVRELPLTGTPSVWMIRNNGNGVLYGDVIGGVVTGVA